MFGIKIFVLIASIHEWVCRGCLRRQNKLEKEIHGPIKGHLWLQSESTEGLAVQDIRISMRAKISQNLYRPYIEKLPLFKGCSAEFINQIVIRLHEEFVLPGEVILEQGNMVDQIYFVSHGVLEEVRIGEDGCEETLLLLEPNSSFGEIAILCNIPLPYAVRVSKLCRLMRLDKRSFINILQMYFFDGRTVLNNVLEAKEPNIWIKPYESDISFLIAKQESELALRVNSAAYHGDLYRLKGLIRAGADPKKADYDGRSPLHLAASKGYKDIVCFLIQKGVNINCLDKFGNSPLFEAIKKGHDRVASLLFKEGASLNIDDAGSLLCSVVLRQDYDFLSRLLAFGANPNSNDYDQRTPLHVAATKGLYWMAKALYEAGANVLVQDRWNRTPLDDGRLFGNCTMFTMALEAWASIQWSCSQNLDRKASASSQWSQYFDRSPEIECGVTYPLEKICTVFPVHPLDPKLGRTKGMRLVVPSTLEELICCSKKLFWYPPETEFVLLPYDADVLLLSQDGRKILDVNMISDEQKLYLIPNERAIRIEREG